MKFSYSRGSDTIEIIIRDSTNRKIETHRRATADKVGCAKLIKMIQEKYGIEIFAPEPPSDDSWVE